MTTITRRTRKLGYGYTAQTEQTPAGLGVKEPKITERGLTPRQLLGSHRDACRVYSGGTDWRFAISVGGKPVAHPRNALQLLEMLVDGALQSVELDPVAQETYL